MTDTNANTDTNIFEFTSQQDFVNFVACAIIDAESQGFLDSDQAADLMANLEDTACEPFADVELPAPTEGN